jgi:hypothetical protein
VSYEGLVCTAIAGCKARSLGRFLRPENSFVVAGWRFLSGLTSISGRELVWSFLKDFCHVLSIAIGVSGCFATGSDFIKLKSPEVTGSFVS